jgi:hypothetical protein
VRRALAALTIGVVLLSALSGCAGPGSLRFQAIDGHATLAPRFATAVYSFQDENTIDIVLSDLPLDFLLGATSDDLQRASGSLVHIHHFYSPMAGRTTLGASGSNSTVRHVVFAGGEVGVYGGGGLVRAGSNSGGSALSVRVTGGTSRLIESTPGFSDQLGVSTFDGRVRAERNDTAADRLTRVVQGTLNRTEGR